MAEIESLTTDAIIALINAGTWPPQFAVTTGNLAAINDAFAVDVHQAATIAIGLKNTGTAADILGAVVFEASVNSTIGTDGDWVSIQMARSNDTTVENGRAAGSLAAGVAQAYAWEASVSAYRWFRVRMTTAVTASAIQKWSAAPSAYDAEPAPSVQSHPVTVSGTPAVTVTGTVAITGTVSETGAVVTTPASETAYQLLAAATINAAIVKAAAAQLLELTVFNPTAAIAYLKLYNKATLVAPATDSALLMYVVAVPVNGTIAVNFGANGKKFPAGIGLALVLNPANTDATAIATAGIVVSATYI